MRSVPGPLQGFTVVEVCQMVAGPWAGTLLADLGAEVIKIEQPAGGDRMRLLGHRVGSIGALWAGVNRGNSATAGGGASLLVEERGLGWWFGGGS